MTVKAHDGNAKRESLLLRILKSACMRAITLCIGVLLAAVCGAAEAWTLDDSAPMPGSFWTITSPDGKWKLACVPSGKDGIFLDGDYSADLVGVREYGWEWTGSNEEYRYDVVDAEDVFGKSVDEGCVVKGSGVLTLPTQARDKSGNIYSIEIGNWSIGGWSQPVRKMTKCIVPADYTAGIGEGTSIACDFEVEEGNSKYYSKDGVLYLKGAAREDGEQGNALWQFPSGKKGTFTIPDGVTLVRTGAFEGCGLSELVIGPDLEDFESDSEVQKTLKKITIWDNGNFVFENGLLLGDGGKSALMVLHGVVGKRLVVPSSVTYVSSYAMAYLVNVKEIYFTSDVLTLEGGALGESENLSVIDFGGVGRLIINVRSLFDVEANALVFPEDVKFEDSCLDLGDGEIKDVYWPTKMGYMETGPMPFYYEDHPFRLHVRKDAGDWSSHGLNGVTVFKDMVEPAKPELPAFLAEGEWVRVGVPVSGELTVADYASLRVAGLPSGIKATYDRKNPGAVTFSGAATKEGTYEVAISYFENGRTVTKIYPLFVDKAPHLTVSVVAGLGGTVKGGGDVYAGKKTTLKATANRGYVFAGWYRDAFYTSPYDGYTSNFDDYRNPNLPIVHESARDEQLDLYAKFIPVEDDGGEIFVYNLYDQYKTKEKMQGAVRISVESMSLPTVKVRGLPPGLKFTAKAIETGDMSYSPNSIYGTPTKSGIYTVAVTAKTAGKKTATSNIVFTVVNRDLGERILKVECDSAMGRVTGGGIYADGKKATLKATPNRGFVFAGWYDADGDPLEGDVDFRSPSFPYTAAGEDVAVWAEFIPAAEDAALELAVDDVSYTSGTFDLTLDIFSRSLPKVALSGLPPGLKFDAKANRISGTATKPGTYTVTAKLTNASVRKAVVQTFTIVVDNLTGANGLLLITDAEGSETSLMNGRGDMYTMSVGVQEFDLPVLNAANEGDKVSLSGLPAGLKYNAKTGRIEGIATKAGVYTVQAKVSSGWASYVSTFTVEVQALPFWAVGTFAGIGLVELPGYDLVEDNLYGTVTVGANGKLSGKFLFDTGDERLLTAAFSAPALTSWECDPEGDGYFLDVTLAFKDGRNVVESRECRFCIEQNNHDGGVGGGMISLVDADGAEITLYQNVWKVKGFENLPVFAEKKTVVSKPLEIHGDDTVIGTSTLMLTFDQKGAVSGTLTDEGTEEGKSFSERFAFKSDLIVTRHWTNESGEYYEAEVPLVIGNLATARAVVKMRVLPDGTAHAAGCEITDCTDFGNWE